jgi:exodeoxyribonuclease VII large subunit
MDLFQQESTRDIFSLSAFTKRIELVIAGAFNDSYWIKAEIARLNHYPESGHCYPDLVEREGGVLKAQMRALIWARDYERISRQFIEVAREQITDGMQILFRASLRYHGQYGLSLQIHDIDPAYSLGQMAKDKLETIRKLAEEGLLERNKALELPLLPKRIAVISVKTSKGFSDFTQIIDRNPDGFSVLYHLFPALLQGDAAVGSILSQLEVIRSLRAHFDVVAIIRGGGGEVGLSCYDNYRLARAVAFCPLPVITGIGHSTNETVVEMVAFQNKITPTDVAYYILSHFRALSERIVRARETLEDSIRELSRHHNTRLKEMAEDLVTRVRDSFRKEEETIREAFSILSFIPLQMLQGEAFEVRNKERLLHMRIQHRMEREKAALKLAEDKVGLLDPINILKRGYSISYYQGTPLREARSIKPGDEVTTRLFSGSIDSIVKQIREENENG